VKKVTIDDIAMTECWIIMTVLGKYGNMIILL